LLGEVDWFSVSVVASHDLIAIVKYSSLDMSFNNIKAIKGLSTLVKLEKLYLINNKIKKIENLDYLTCLTMLELGDNRIRVSLDNMPILWNSNMEEVGGFG